MNQRNELFIPYSRRDGQSGVRVDLRMAAFFGIVLVLLGLASWLYLRQASEAARLASAVREQLLRREALHRELIILHAEVATLGSLKRVLREGTEMGYRLYDVGEATNQLVIECPGCRQAGADATWQLPGAADTAVQERNGPWQMLVEWLSGRLGPGPLGGPSN